MLPKSAVDRLIPILKKDVRRILRMQVAGFPKPYFCGLLLRDVEWFNTWASAGSTYRRRSDHTRNVYCDIRVGSYRYDQVTDGGLHDNDEEAESYNHITVPIDDSDYTGLRLAIWRLSEAKFREALTEYNEKEAVRLSTVSPSDKFHALSRVQPQQHVRDGRPERIREEYWVRYCKLASKWMSSLPHVSGSWVEFDSTQESRVFVNTEGTVVVQHQRVYQLRATFRRLTREGSHLEQELNFTTAALKELPSFRTFKVHAKRKYQQLIKLMRARKIHSFSGPVLLYPSASALLFHEAIGHRLEGSRLLAKGEGQTFKDQLGKRVLNVDLNIHDNPKLKNFQGVRCVGAYDYDDEGVPAKNATLVEGGVLKGFLTTRSPIQTGKFNSNGHARTHKHQRPISRMAVTIIEGKNGIALHRLRKRLIEEIRRQGKPFGMIVYDAMNGETETSSYNFQAFLGDIAFATLVFPNGKEICVRGVNFVGTPLQALNNVIAYGNKLELDNSFCGAESGFIPVTTIAPAVLLSNLELQTKDEELVTQYILPRPRLN